MFNYSISIVLSEKCMIVKYYSQTSLKSFKTGQIDLKKKGNTNKNQKKKVMSVIIKSTSVEAR